MLTMLSTEVRRRDGQVPLMLQDNLLDESLPFDQLINVLQIRWFAARQMKKLELIAADVRRLECHAADDADQWLRILGEALRLVILKCDVDVVADIRQRLDAMPIKPIEHWVLNQVDSDKLLHDAWIKAGSPNFPCEKNDVELLRSLLDVAGSTWEQSSDRNRGAVLAVCQKLSADPARSLPLLSALRKSCSPIVHRLCEIFAEQQTFGVDRFDELPDVIQQELRRRLRGALHQYRTPQFAFELLDICRKLVVTVKDIAQTLNRMENLGSISCVEIADQCGANSPLDCLVRAEQALMSLEPNIS